MPLTAFDPDTGRIVLATWAVSSPQCKDPTCRAKLSLVRGTDARVQHFRHVVHSQCRSADQTRDQDAKSPWHFWWQSQTDDPSRVEVTDVNAAGDVRRADILTKFGWCIEVQHSGIAAGTVRARENHWNGKVLWLVDAASSDRRVDFSMDDRWARLDGPWVQHLSTVIAVDDGQYVWLFPWTVIRSGGQVASNTSYLRRFDHAEFIRDWINADGAPFTKEPSTKWRKDSLDRAARTREDIERREKAAQARMLREQREADLLCEYQGPRSNLIHEQPVPPPTMSPVSPTPPTPPAQPARRYEVVVDIRDTPPDPAPERLPITNWRKSDASRHPVTKLPGHTNRTLACRDCARLLAHDAGRLKCDANWTPSTTTDIDPSWAACSVWLPNREDS